MKLSSRARRFVTITGFVAAAVVSTALADEPVAITNVTVIDGNGGPPRANSTVVVNDGVIVSLSDTDSDLPGDAAVIDGRGKYLLPGFIDSNVHASVYGNSSRRETAVKYGERNEALALEFAQRQLMHGVTTVRDSYGSLIPLIQVRDRINRGEVVGARLLVAGNIVGWGGPFSMTFSLMQESELTLFQATWNDLIAQGVGEELMDMGPEEVRSAINVYLDKGPDFIKYGGTSHFSRPSLIGFSPRIQRVIVEETHKRGLIAETHSTSPEALRMTVEAGIDLIQHPEILSRDYPEDLLQMIVDRDIVCGIRSNTLGGQNWQDHLQRKAMAEASLADAAPPATSAEVRARQDMLGHGYEIQRRNAVRLIAAGCIVSIATDNYQGRAPEFRKVPKPENHEAGIGSIIAIEGLVELGMSEAEAIVAATRNGAIAAGRLERIGTIEEGKDADLILLAANPLDDISNIRTLEHVIAQGRIIDLASLPEQRLFYHGPTLPSAGVSRPIQPPEKAVAAAAGAEVVKEVSPNEYAEGLGIVSIYESSIGNLTLELANGQTWRQLSSDDIKIVLPRDQSGLTADVSKGFMNSVNLKISNTGKTIKVRRIN